MGDNNKQSISQQGNHNQQFNATTINYHAAQQQTPKRIIPYSRNPNFISRQELSQIQGRTALYGIGGVGKSQIAIEYAYQFQEWALWIHASSAARFDQDIQKIAGVAGLQGNVFRLLYQWLLEKSWLIVLDSLDDADFLFQPVSDDPTPRIEYFPANGTILVTTRHRDIAYRLADTQIEVLPDRAHAVALLQATFKEPAGELAAALDYMPLAISQAAAYIKRRPRFSIERYLEQLKSDTSLLTAEFHELRRDGREAKNAILLTWQISFEHIYATRPSAGELLSLMSFYDHHGIPETLLDCDDDDVELLVDYSLITISPNGYEMHRLVQMSAQLWSSNTSKHEEREAKAIQRLDAVFPNAEHETWVECRVLYPHAIKMLEDTMIATSLFDKDDWPLTFDKLYPHAIKPLGHTTSLTLASLLDKAGRFAYSQGLYVEAETMFRRCADADQSVAAKNSVALMLHSQGEYAESEMLIEQILSGCLEAEGTEWNLDMLKSLSNLALVMEETGHLKKSLELNECVLFERTQRLGDRHPDTLLSFNNLGRVLHALEQYKEAEIMIRRALEGRAMVFGADHPRTLTSLNNLGRILSARGKHDEAEQSMRRVVAGREIVLGKEHPRTLTSVDHLALVLRHAGKYDEAEQLNRYALAGKEKVLGECHPRTVGSLYNLIQVVREQRRDVDELEKEYAVRSVTFLTTSEF